MGTVTRNHNKVTDNDWRTNDRVIERMTMVMTEKHNGLKRYIDVLDENMSDVCCCCCIFLRKQKKTKHTEIRVDEMI